MDSSELPFLFLTSKNHFPFNNYCRKDFSLWKHSHEAMEKNKLITVKGSGLFCSIILRVLVRYYNEYFKEDYSKTIHDSVIILVTHHSSFPSPLISGKKNGKSLPLFLWSSCSLRETEGRIIILDLHFIFPTVSLMIWGLHMLFSTCLSKDVSLRIKYEGKIIESITTPGCCCPVNEWWILVTKCCLNSNVCVS